MRWYGHPVGGVLVDSHMIVSGAGLPTWDGLRQGLRFPDRIIAVDGIDLAQSEDAPAAWDHSAVSAVAAGQSTLHVTVSGAGGMRELDLRIEPFQTLAWWVMAGIPILIGGLYALVAVAALVARPDGALARSTAKATFFAAIFMFGYFDFHTARHLLSVFDVAMVMVPVSFAVVALRLPDDVPLLARHPWVERALDVVGVVGGLALHHGEAASTLPRTAASMVFAGGQFFFVAAIVVRFFYAHGKRRASLRSLLGAMLAAHVPAGMFVVLSLGRARGTPFATLIVPALALSPFATILAFVRHDIWKSGGILSRVATRITASVVTCVVSLALATVFAVWAGVDFRGALIAASAGAVASTLLVTGVLAAIDRGIFASRAEYKPTIEQLSEELTAIDALDDVAAAVERTVRRWLACKKVAFVAGAAAPAQTAPDSKDLAIEVRFRGTTLGVLEVGEKAGGALFTTEDVDLLRTIANQAALALAHAHAYAELEARRKQQAAAWRDERAAIVETVAAEIAHEVRYPINFFRSIFRRGKAELDDEAIEIGSEEVERLERLVTGLRRVTERRLERRSVPLAELAARAETLGREEGGRGGKAPPATGLGAVRAGRGRYTKPRRGSDLS